MEDRNVRKFFTTRHNSGENFSKPRLVHPRSNTSLRQIVHHTNIQRVDERFYSFRKVKRACFFSACMQTNFL